MTDAEILAVAGALAGGACHAATGFGFALVAAPLVVAALPPERAICTLLVLGILTSSLTLATERRTPNPLWRESGQILAWGAGGALAGAFLLGELNRTALQLLVSASVVATLATRELTRRRGRPVTIRQRWLVPAGVAAGALTTTTTANGPPLLLYLLARRVPAAAMRDTLSVLFVAFGVVGMAAIVVGEADFTLPGAGLVLLLGAAAAAGHVAGRPLFRRLAAGHYDRAVGALLLVSVVTGAIVALAW